MGGIYILRIVIILANLNVKIVQNVNETASLKTWIIFVKTTSGLGDQTHLLFVVQLHFLTPLSL